MKIMITGITGTLGTELRLRFLAQGHEVLGISRDEQKQRQIPTHERLHLRLADVRNLQAVYRASVPFNPDRIFHLAALKCVDTLEFNPQEAIETNIKGSENMVYFANDTGAELIFTSTDKAAYPVNVYGMSKAIAERLVLGAGHTVVRYGNVMGSRGSFIPSLILSLKSEGKAYVTDKRMTRFWMSQRQAADFVCRADTRPGGKTNALYVPDKIRAASLPAIVKAVASFCGVERYEIEEIGARPGEKMHECLRTEEEGGLIRSDDPELQFDPRSLEQFVIAVMKGDV
jgi:FlaA1/EpsC-like NDP-sugar epimerase